MTASSVESMMAWRSAGYPNDAAMRIPFEMWWSL
jgi:hypothetical protein